MPTFKVRTYEEHITVEADSIEYCTDGVRLLFITNGKVIAGFSRYLWVQELKAEPATDTAAPEAPAAQDQAE